MPVARQRAATLVCSDEDVAAVLSYEPLLEVVADAFRAQATGRVERPAPHLNNGVSPEIHQYLSGPRSEN